MRRHYPEAPIASVGAVVTDGERVLLVRRGQEPLKGEWSVPGGAVELGETLEQAVCREVLEETGLLVEPIGVVEVLDRISRDGQGRVTYHYVLVDYVCRVVAGVLCCGSDAADLRWVARDELESVGLPAVTLGVIQNGMARALAGGCETRGRVLLGRLG